MKCISLWQPWATLIALGEKTIETRSSSTDYRGPLAIHAAKKWGLGMLALTRSEPLIAHRLRYHGISFDTPGLNYATLQPPIPFAAVVAVADLVGCERTENLDSRLWIIGRQVSIKERAFGDYTPGRWAWILDNIRKVDPPIYCRGARGLFRLPPDVETQLATTATAQP